MGQQIFIAGIGLMETLVLLAIIVVPLLHRFAPALLRRLGRASALSPNRAAALELAAVPASRIAAATRSGAGGAPQGRPVTKADQDLAHEILMGMIRSIPTDPGMDHPVSQAIVFRQLFPPPHDRTSLSFFGGVPIAPPSFA